MRHLSARNEPGSQTADSVRFEKSTRGKVKMAAKEYQDLVALGFSELFLKSVAGSHPNAKKAVKHSPETWRTCMGCKKNYADISRIKGPVLDKKGHDLRKRKVDLAQRAGFCSWNCALNEFGDYGAARSALEGICLAFRPDFYELRQWRNLRYDVLKERGARCECCGRTAQHGIIIHVDHIKPKSRFPHLALDINNLQVLCADCNLGKGARDDTDWRKYG